jgi:hypothetical protein
MKPTLVLHLGIATRYQEHINSHCACGAGTSRLPIAPFPRLDGVPVAACLGAHHGSIPRPPCPLRGRGKGEIRFRWQHMPPKTRGWTPRSSTLSPLPRPPVRGAGLRPQATAQTPRGRCGPIQPRWGGVAAWSAAWAWHPWPGFVVRGANELRQGFARVSRLTPLSFRSGSPNSPSSN